MPAFTVPEDIANRALQHVGAQRITSLTEDSRNAAEILACYDRLREAELRRNVWACSIRHALLRATGFYTMLLAPAAYASGTTYALGALIVDSTGWVWQSQAAGNVGNTPGPSSTQWTLYTGPRTYEPYDSTQTYNAGDVAYLAPAYNSGTTYHSGDVVLYANALYQSTYGPGTTNILPTVGGSLWSALGTVNFSYAPTNLSSFTVWLSTVASNTIAPVTGYDWVQLAGTVSQFRVLYPLGAGPSTDPTTRNIYALPYSFLREAPQDPKAGSVSLLGASSARRYDDWLIENGMLVTREVGAIAFRFAASVLNVPQFDPMFCEGLAARIGEEVCEVLTQSTEKIKICAAAYLKVMGEARTVNGIEQGPVEAPEDDFLTCRL